MTSLRRGESSALILGAPVRADAAASWSLRWGPLARPFPLAIVALVLAAFAVTAGQRTPLPATTAPPAASTAGAPTADEAYRWRPVAIGGGGFIVGLAFDRAGKTFVARTDVHGAYLWRPEANRWAQLLTEATLPAALRRPAGIDTGVVAIAVAPGDGRWIYLVAKGMLLRSNDRGASWIVASSGPFPLEIAAAVQKFEPALAISPRDPAVALLGTPRAGVWRTIDGGVSWTQASGVPVPTAGPTPTAPTLVWFAPRAAGGGVWAIVPGRGLFVSRDDGMSFAAAPGQAMVPAVLAAGDFAPDGTFYGADWEGKAIWRWRTGAWTNLPSARLAKGRYAAVAVDPADGAIYAIEGSGVTHRSADGGESWRRIVTRTVVGEGDPPWLHVAAHPFFATAQARFDPVVPHRLWLAGGTGVFRADIPPGALWLTRVSQARGIEELVSNDVVQAPGHAPLFAAWDFGIHVKPDLDAFSTTYGPRERMIIAAQQIALTPADPNFAVTNASDTRNCCAEDGDAVMAGYSEDAGRTWTKFATLPQPPGTRADDPWRMAFGTIAVSASDRDDIVWMPSYDRAPFYTRDRGRTWQQVHFPGEHLPFTGSHPAKHLQRKVLAADPVAGGTFYLAHSGTASNPQLAGLWASTDGGATWQRRSPGEVAPRSNQAAKLRAMPGRTGDLWFTAGLNAGPDTRLRRSRDGGRTWQIVRGIDRVDDIAFGKAARGTRLPTIFLSGFVDGAYGVWRSVDDGARWQRIAFLPLGTVDRVTVLGADPDVFGRVYIGLMGSGWVYGEPAPCRPAPLQPFAREECVGVAR